MSAEERDAAVKRRWDRLEETKPATPHCWIQWKGTAVCMDVYCECGKHTHVDAEFCYRLRCGECGRLYDVAGYVRLVPVPPEDEDAGGCAPVVSR